MNDHIVNKIKYLVVGVFPLFFYFVLSLVWQIPFLFQSNDLVLTGKVVIAILFLAMWGVTAYKLEEQETLKFMDYGLTHLLGLGLIIVALIAPFNSLSELYYVTVSSALSPHQPGPISMAFSLVLMLTVFILSSNVAKRKKHSSP